MSVTAIELREHASLESLNTLRLPAHARWLAHIHDPAALPDWLAQAQWRGIRRQVLGGGSNVVLTGDLDGLVLHPRFVQIGLQETESDTPLLVADAGHDWAELVQWSLDQGLCGLENLGLIPGQAGAAPMQNIGAYGVELERFVEWVEWLNLSRGQLRQTSRAQARFAYRDSWFKTLEPGSFLITRLALRLSRKFYPQLHYPGLREELERAGVSVATATATDVHAAVCALRRAKLPDPQLLPNAGSFFKNPVLDTAQVSSLQQAFPTLPAWPQADGRVKLSAAWLIEQCGFKGRIDGAVGVAPGHALVLVHHGGGTGTQLLALAQQIQRGVAERFGIALEIEPVRL